MQSHGNSKRNMLYPTKLTWIFVGIGMLGVLRAEDAIIYGTTASYQGLPGLP